jgi:hypothetical protein
MLRHPFHAQYTGKDAFEIIIVLNILLNKVPNQGLTSFSIWKTHL